MKKTILLMLAACSFAASKGQQRDSNVFVYSGDKVPLFEVTAADGAKVSSSESDGKVMLVVFYATWCPHCQHELPELQEVYAKYGSRDDFKIMPIHINRMESREKVAEYFGTNGFTMPYYFDLTGEAMSKFAKGGVPRSYLVGKDGRVMQTVTGYAKDEKTGVSNFSIITSTLDRILR
jgi:thiol-disulfide isomerase/thioredoxin